MLEIERPQAVVFDCDGLLVETESWWERAMTEIVVGHGGVMDADLRERMLGVSVDFTGQMMADRMPERPDGDVVKGWVVARVLELVSENAQVMPGALEVVKALAKTDVPFAVASNSPTDIVHATLARGGMTDYFKHVITTDDVTNPKPDPDIYLVACKRLGSDPRASLALEDSPTGVNSAKAAGMKVLAVPSLEGLDMNADWILPTLDNEELLACIAKW